MSESSNKTSYRQAGVDIEAGDQTVSLIANQVGKGQRPEVLSAIGGFAGLFKINWANYREPIIAASTDGVGTKIAIAQEMDRHDTIGIDLVAMVVDDLVVCGAEPLFIQDYIATGKVVPEKIAEIIKGVVTGCELAGTALLGGETAEHPKLMHPNEYDISATGVGIVEADQVLDSHRVKPGDIVIGFRSSGLHSNGYSLARYVLLEISKLSLNGQIEDLGKKTLGEELLTPTKIYAKDCLRLIHETDVHAFAHITGGGLANNLSRVLPKNVTAQIDRSAWQPQPIFYLIEQLGKVAPEELETTYNMGVGMVAIVAPDDTERALALLTASHVEASIIGEIVKQNRKSETDSVVLHGSHPRF